MSELRTIWRQRWLESINELTSISLQQSTWQKPPDESPHWSFVEFMCCYFDDVLADQSYEELVKRKWIEESEFLVIRNWHTKLNQYKSPNNDDYDNSAILKDPEWQVIAKEGLEAKNRLLELLNEAEKKFLTELNIA